MPANPVSTPALMPRFDHVHAPHAGTRQSTSGPGSTTRRILTSSRRHRSSSGRPGRQLCLLLAAIFLAVMILPAPIAVHAAAGQTYTRTTSIVSGGKYLLVANITNYPLDPASTTAAPTVLGTPLMNSLMIGTRAFSLNGSVLTSTADLNTWEVTATATGTSDGGNPGYTLKFGSSFVNVTQGLTNYYRQFSNGFTWPLSATMTMNAEEFVSDPYTHLSGTARTWYWDGAAFYTIYSSDTTSLGQLANPPPNPNNYYYGYVTMNTESATNGLSQWVTVNWSNMGNSAVYTNSKLYLMGVRPGQDKVYPPAYQYLSGGDMTYTQQMFANKLAVAASTMFSTGETPGINLYDNTREAKKLSLYQLDVLHTGITVNARLDDAAYSTYGGAVRLTSSLHTYDATAVSGAATFASVVAGTYSIYADGLDTGVDVTVNSNGASANIDFYSLSYGHTLAGLATGGSVTATDTGTGQAFSGAAALKGRSFSFTASGSGANAYSYAWSGATTSSGNTATLTSISAPAAVSSTITGYRNVTIGKVTSAAVTGQAYKASTFDLASLFTIDANAGAATYAVTGGSGTGTVGFEDGTPNASGRYLKVTACGTFNIQVSTAASGYYLAGSQTNTLTVADTLPVIASITAPAAVTDGGYLDLTTPVVDNQGTPITASGWQISPTGALGSWTDLPSSRQAFYSQNGYRLHYHATNGAGTITSNAVQITVNPIVVTLKRNNSDASGSTDGSLAIAYGSSAPSSFTAPTRIGYTLEGLYATILTPGPPVPPLFLPAFIFTPVKVLNADGSLVSSDVDGWIDGGTWANSSSSQALDASWLANPDTAFVIVHVRQNIDGTYSLDHAALKETDPRTGTTGSEVTFSGTGNSKAYTGFTYSYGSTAFDANGASTGVTGATILADGSRVIYQYYTRNSYDITYIGTDDATFAVKPPLVHLYGVDLAIPDPAMDGYVFQGWLVASGKSASADPAKALTLNGTDFTSNLALTAIWNHDTSPSGNQITGAPPKVIIGQNISFTAIGSGLDIERPLVGDRRYRPVGWRFATGGASGTFPPEGPFSGTLSTAGMTFGSHTLIVTYTTEFYGEDWLDTGETVTVSTMVIIEQEAIPVTGEPDHSRGLGLAALMAALALLVSRFWLVRRRLISGR